MDRTDYLQQEIARINQQIEENKQWLGDAEIAQLAKEEIAKLEKTKQDLESGQLDDHQRRDESFTSPSQGINSNVAILEFRQAAGGDEAKIWANDLKRMYIRHANTQNWKVFELDEAIIKIKGAGVFDALRYESGVHRVQRVPVTESQGRTHTSTATVAVLPEMTATQVNLDDNEIEFVAFRRASGAGGQNVNKVATAVRLTHKPTGITVEASHERTQTANREFARQLLAAKIWELEEEKRLAKLSDARAAIGRGMRAEKIRTYNYPQNRVTDHRINISWQELDQIIDGRLDRVIKALHGAFSND